MRFWGTMFAPTTDRLAPGKGFTHLVGDVVTVSTPKLGTLVNRVNHTDKIAPWTFGVSALMGNLARGGLLANRRSRAPSAPPRRGAGQWGPRPSTGARGAQSRSK